MDTLKIKLRRLLQKVVFRYFFPQQPPLEWLLRNLNDQLEEVVFLQIGANDGITGDPSARYKRRENWRGILVEPQPGAYSRLVENFPEDRYYKANCAIGTASGTCPLYRLGFTEARWANGLASFQKDTIARHFADGYIQRKAEQEEGIRIPPDANPDDYITSDPVETLTLEQLMQRAGNPEVNAAFIDVEGYDFEILKLLDLESEALKIVIYENKHLSADDREAATHWLAARGYKVFHCGPNSIALRRLFVPLTWGL